jgi:hypothetical protein
MWPNVNAIYNLEFALGRGNWQPTEHCEKHFVCLSFLMLPAKEKSYCLPSTIAAMWDLERSMAGGTVTRPGDGQVAEKYVLCRQERHKRSSRWEDGEVHPAYSLSRSTLKSTQATSKCDLQVQTAMKSSHCSKPAKWHSCKYVGPKGRDMDGNQVFEIKGKVHPCKALRLCTARRGSRGIALLFHNHDTRRVWGVSVTPRPLFLPRKGPVPIVQEVGRSPGPV